MTTKPHYIYLVFLREKLHGEFQLPELIGAALEPLIAEKMKNHAMGGLNSRYAFVKVQHITYENK